MLLLTGYDSGVAMPGMAQRMSRGPTNLSKEYPSMKKISCFLAALSLGVSASFAMAQPGPPPGAGPGEGRPHPPRDCSKAPDAEKKARCESMQAAMEKCKDKKQEERRACMKEAMPKRDQPKQDK